MKKLLLALMLGTSLLMAGGTQGFLSNQKYVCIAQGLVQDGQMVMPMSQEEAMKNPVRFYVDDNNVMHTDKPMQLANIGDKTYSDGDNTMILIPAKDNRYIFSFNKELQSIGAAVAMVCTETNNWTLAQ